LTNTSKKYNFSSFGNIFCDSEEAIIWAFKHKLPKDTLIRTSSPALLFGNNANIVHVESRWSETEMKKFQTTIKNFSEEVFDAVLQIDGVSHEEALCVAQESVAFHRILFKAACLTEKDLVEPRLFVRAKGKNKLRESNLNSPWDLLIGDRENFKVVTYDLADDNWSTLTTEGVTFIERIRIGGIETVIYRLITKFLNKLIGNIYSKYVLIPSENELVIEVASSLALKGVGIREIKPLNINRIAYSEEKLSVIKLKIHDIVKERIKKWVDPRLVLKCETLFFSGVEIKLNSFVSYVDGWKPIISKFKDKKSVLLLNSPGNISGFALTNICKNVGIPIVSAQHGVTKEICATHGESVVSYDINVSDYFLSYNNKSSEVANNSYFSRGKSFTSGISARHLRMKYGLNITNCLLPIVYISTNLYKGNLGGFGAWLTDYDRARNEQKIVSNVLSKLPHKIRYKTYPEENRRYADIDPIISDIKATNNVELFDKKVDMRFLLKEHRVIVTSSATSTLGWCMMTEKPVVFINWKNKMPLTIEAKNSLSNAAFVFNENDDDFHNNLCKFLSKTIEEIEYLWNKKKSARKEFINKFITSYQNGAGKRASELIFNKYY
jgi:hypothetical protein